MTMTPEQQLLETWRQLSQTLQQEVLDFAQFLAERRRSKPLETQDTLPPKSGLASLVGAAPGSFDSPEAADAFIRQERDAWDS
jgi:hypothetical protein